MHPLLVYGLPFLAFLWLWVITRIENGENCRKGKNDEFARTWMNVNAKPLLDVRDRGEEIAGADLYGAFRNRRMDQGLHG